MFLCSVTPSARRVSVLETRGIHVPARNIRNVSMFIHSYSHYPSARRVSVLETRGIHVPARNIRNVSIISHSFS
jgi:hypothetical protein